MRRNLAILALVALGFLQMIGLLAGSPALRGAGFATAAAPLPLVFSVYRGVETFASSFEVEVRTAGGQVHRQAITPALYARLGGPYNRRNAYGAVFSHGPLFDDPRLIALRQEVLAYGLLGGGPLARDFGLPADLAQVQIRIRSLTRGAAQDWTLELQDAP